MNYSLKAPERRELRTLNGATFCATNVKLKYISARIFIGMSLSSRLSSAANDSVGRFEKDGLRE